MYYSAFSVLQFQSAEGETSENFCILLQVALKIAAAESL